MNTIGRHGLVIGKFYPPHLGHHHLISTAATMVDRLTVLVMASAAESIPLTDRVCWLREVHAESNVHVLGVPCDIPLDLSSETIWTAQVAVMKAAVEMTDADPVDTVLTGEDYGPELARRFGARHVPIDPARTLFRISGTAVRANLVDSWADLHPVVRRGLTNRIVVVGAESTGTTTLSRALAEHYRAKGGVWATTGWVPEYGREFTYLKHAEAVTAARDSGTPDPTVADLVWTTEDFARIAQTQTQMEDDAAGAGSPLLVCDTDAFATSVWEYRYLGPYSHGADDAATHLPPRTVYLLTDHGGVPFEDDGWRDGEHLRASMTGWFTDRLTRAGHSWVLLTGSPEERLDLAVRVVEETLAQRLRFGDPLGHVPTELSSVQP